MLSSMQSETAYILMPLPLQQPLSALYFIETIQSAGGGKKEGFRENNLKLLMWNHCKHRVISKLLTRVI